MSRATKRKHVVKEVLTEFILPEPHQQIVKVAGGRGNNLHDVIAPDGSSFLVSMPTKYRKNIWIKRGDYIMINPIEEGDRVQGEIALILYKEQIKYIKENKLWPAEFEDSQDEALDQDQIIPDDMLPPSDYDEDSEDDKETDSHGNNICEHGNSDVHSNNNASKDSGSSEDDL